MGYYLMIKTIDQTGMNYLCKCIDNKDHISYKGSGVYWRRILNKHSNYTISTKILGHYDTAKELVEQGSYYSELYDVVENENWANCMPETGDGGDTLRGRKKYYNPDTDECKYFYENQQPIGWLRGVPKSQRRKGFKRYHNPKTNKILHLYPNDKIPEGFIKGGIKGRFKYGPKIGVTTYNNGIRKILLAENEEIPEGFVKGSGLQTTLGKTAYHHIITRAVRFLNDDEEIPKDFVKGNDKKNGSPEWNSIIINGIDFRNTQEACDHFDLHRETLLMRLDKNNNLRSSKDVRGINKKIKINEIVFKNIELAMKHFDITRYKLLKYYKVEYL